MIDANCSYATQRLLVREWHSFTADEWSGPNLEVAVMDILTPQVTCTLPPVWQGAYTIDRARNWIRERDSEGITLLVVEQATGLPIGLLILFESGCSSDGSELRLGYMLAESSWGNGFASELISGFVQWCGNNAIASVSGGVEHANIASRRVLEKCGFVSDPASESASEQLFVLNFK